MHLLLNVKIYSSRYLTQEHVPQYSLFLVNTKRSQPGNAFAYIKILLHQLTRIVYDQNIIRLVRERQMITNKPDVSKSLCISHSLFFSGRNV